MANQALALAESALRSRKLDRTLTTALPPLDRVDAAALVATDVAVLDSCLGGGLPRGHVSELAAAARPGMSRHVQTAGRTTLLLQMMAAATRRGELVALIDACDALDVASAIAAGVDVRQFLWVRGTAPVSPPAMVHPATTIDRILDRALKAVTLVLQAGGFGLVAIDLADIPGVILKRLPFTTWLRVQRMVEGRDTACVLVVPEPLARSAGGVTLSLHESIRQFVDSSIRHYREVDSCSERCTQPTAVRVRSSRQWRAIFRRAPRRAAIARSSST
jgi:hypothetical protein